MPAKTLKKGMPRRLAEAITSQVPGSDNDIVFETMDFLPLKLTGLLLFLCRFSCERPVMLALAVLG